MFGLSFFEVFFIMVIALLVFGPEKLPEIAKSLGKLTGEVKKNTDALRREFYNSVYPPATQIRNDIRELKTSPVKKIGDALEAMEKETREAPDAEISKGSEPQATPENAPNKSANQCEE
jgi:TatA/E family protein of Tat protein translocase